MNTGELIKVEQQLLSPEFQEELQSLNRSSRFKLKMGLQCMYAVDAVKQSTALQNCKPESIFKAVKDIAMLGLTLNPKLGQAYLIPRKGECCADIGYLGMVSVLYEYKVAREVFANVIYVGDTFRFNYITNKVDEYIPYHILKKERGEEMGVFACSIDFDGYYRYVYIPIDRVNEIIENIDSYKYAMAKKAKGDFYSTIYDSINRSEMIKKFAIRHLFKLSPKNESYAEVANFIELHDKANAQSDTSFTEKGDEVQTHSVKASETRVTNANSKMKPIIPKNNRKATEAEIVPEKTPVEELKGTDNVTSLAKEATTDTVVIDPNAKDEILSTFTENYSLGDRSTRTSGEVTEMFEILEERGFKRELIEEHVAKGSKSFKTAEELLLKGQEEQIGAVLGKILEVQAAQQQELFSPK